MNAQTPRNVLHKPCATCAREIEAAINRPLREKLLTDGFYFAWCEHASCHLAWSEPGYVSTQRCISREQANRIDRAFVAAGTFHRLALASYLGAELVRYTRPDRVTTSGHDDDHDEARA